MLKIVLPSFLTVYIFFFFQKSRIVVFSFSFSLNSRVNGGSNVGNAIWKFMERAVGLV
jgi:hypothetical protein